MMAAEAHCEEGDDGTHTESTHAEMDSTTLFEQKLLAALNDEKKAFNTGGKSLRLDDTPVQGSLKSHTPGTPQNSDEKLNQVVHSPQGKLSVGPPDPSSSTISAVSAEEGEAASTPKEELAELPSSQKQAPLREADVDAPLPSSNQKFLDLLEAALPAEAFPSEGATANPEEVGPLEARLRDSRPNVRTAALKELANIFSNAESAEAFLRPENVLFIETLPKCLADRNANCQKNALDALLAFFERSNPANSQQAAEVWASVAKSLYENCANQARLVTTVAKTTCAVVAALGSEPYFTVINESLDSFIDKKGKAAVRGPPAKFVANIFTAMRAAIHSFGPMSLGVTHYLGRASKFTAVTENIVKQAAYNVLLETYLCTKSIELVTSQLTDKQKDEMERRCAAEAEAEVVKPTMILKNDSQENAAEEKADNNGSVAEIEDIYDLLPEVDICVEVVPDRWERQLQGAQKWKERQFLLDQLTTACTNAKKVKPASEIGVFVNSISRLLQQDSNLPVVAAAFRALAALANSMRTNFCMYARSVATTALAKLKERSKPVLVAVQSVLAAILLCAPFDLYLDDVAKCVADKNPNARELALEWCSQALTVTTQKRPSAALSKMLPRILSFATETIDDREPAVRSAASSLLHRISDTKPELVTRILNALSGRKKTAVEEALKRQATPPAKSEGRDNRENRAVEPTFKPRERSQRPETSGSTRPRSTSVPQKSQPVTGLIPSEPSVPMENAVSLLGDALGNKADMLGLLTPSNPWNVRVETIESLTDWVQEHDDVVQLASPLAIYMKEAVTANFKEVNAAVNKAVLMAAAILVERPGCPKEASAVFIRGYADKIADAKLGNAYKTLFLRIAEQFTPRFCCAILIEVLQVISNPKAHAEGALFLEQIFTEFAGVDIDLPSTLHYCKFCFDQRAPATRTAAQKLLVTICRFKGMTILNCSDIKAVIVEDVMRQINKLHDHPLPAATRHPKHPEVDVPVPAGSYPDHGASPPSQQGTEPSSSPRNNPVIIKPFLTQALIKSLSDPVWKTRKNAATRLIEIITKDCGGCVSTQQIHEFIGLLRSRVQLDPNKPTLKELLTVLEVLAPALGRTGCRQVGQQLLPLLFTKLSDRTAIVSKALVDSLGENVIFQRPPLTTYDKNEGHAAVLLQIRDACHRVLTVWREVGGLTLLIANLISSQVLLASGEERTIAFTILAEAPVAQIAEAASDAEGRATLDALFPFLLDLMHSRAVGLRRECEDFLRTVTPYMSAAVVIKELRGVRADGQSRAFLAELSRTAGTQLAPLSRRESSAATGQETLSGVTTATTASQDFKSDGFVAKLGNFLNGNKRVEAYRQSSRWSVNLTEYEISALCTAWQTNVNDPLLTAMFEKNAGKFARALSYWTHLLCSERDETQHSQQVDLFSESAAVEGKMRYSDLYFILLRWCILRFIQYPSALTADAAFTLLSRFLRCANGCTAAAQETAEIIWNDVLPILMEFGGIMAHEEHGQMIQRSARVCVEFCGNIDPNKSFLILMRGTASENMDSLTFALTLVASLIHTKGTSTCCSDIARDVSKLTAIADFAGSPAVYEASICCLLAANEHSPIVDLIPSEKIKKEVLTLAPIATEKLRSADAAQQDHGNDEVDLDKTLHSEKGGIVGNEAAPILEDDFGFKDYEASFEALVESLGFETCLAETQQELAEFSRQLTRQERVTYVRDLAELVRRIYEGRVYPDETEICRVNCENLLRIEIPYVLQFIENLRRLRRNDAASVEAGAVALATLFEEIAKQISSSSGAPTAAEEPNRLSTAEEAITLLACEAFPAASAALGFCFDRQKLSSCEVERESRCAAGYKVVALLNKLVRYKQALCRASLPVLTDVFRALLNVMSGHKAWAGTAVEDALVKRLNSTVANHIMAVVSPRTAASVAGLCIELLIDSADEEFPDSPQVEVALAIRVHRKLIRKLNARHIVNPTAPERKYYLRMLDMAVLALMRLDGGPVLSAVEALTEIPPEFSQTAFEEARDVDGSRLKTQLELLIKELIYIATVILGPGLAAVYFRDVGYFDLQTYLNPEKTDFLKTEEEEVAAMLRGPPENSAESPPPTAASAAPGAQRIPNGSPLGIFLAERQWPRGDEDQPDNYFDVHQQFHESAEYTTEGNPADESGARPQTGELVSPPLRYPIFDFAEFLSAAPPGVTLSDIDPTLGTGWIARRETKPGRDLIPATEVLPVRSTTPLHGALVSDCYLILL